jgi:hypothetical protein
MSGLRFLLACASVAVLTAQSAPTAYTITEINNMFGPTVSATVYRNGSKVLVDSNSGPFDGRPQGSHTRALYDLNAHTNYAWDLLDTSSGCGGSNFSGDWGDPFAMAAGLTAELATKNPKETGRETMNGFATKVVEALDPQTGKVKAWIDIKSGLLIKAQVIPASGAPNTILEVKQYTAGPPAASIFVPPVSCATVKIPPTEKERIAAETGGNADDFANATHGPGSKASCTVLLRVVKEGSMEPVTSGFQVAVDRTVDMDHPGSYVYGVGEDGTYTFSGGGLHELTSQLRDGVLRIENVPAQFHLEVHYGKSGGGGGLIYRQCSAPETVLLHIMKDGGGDWLWVKSGKYATIPK